MKDFLEYDEDIQDSINKLRGFLGDDIDDCFNFRKPFVNNLKNETETTIGRIQEQEGASPLSPIVVGLQECNEELKKPNSSVKEKIVGFLDVLSKWARQISESIEGEKYLTRIVDLFKGIANDVQHQLSQFFRKEHKAEESVIENTSDGITVKNGN